jgi:hypothetical protein
LHDLMRIDCKKKKIPFPFALHTATAVAAWKLRQGTVREVMCSRSSSSGLKESFSPIDSDLYPVVNDILKSTVRWPCDGILKKT